MAGRMGPPAGAVLLRAISVKIGTASRGRILFSRPDPSCFTPHERLHPRAQLSWLRLTSRDPPRSVPKNIIPMMPFKPRNPRPLLVVAPAKHAQGA
jgi:hypothetical protein